MGEGGGSKIPGIKLLFMLVGVSYLFQSLFGNYRTSSCIFSDWLLYPETANAQREMTVLHKEAVHSVVREHVPLASFAFLGALIGGQTRTTRTKCVCN